MTKIGIVIPSRGDRPQFLQFALKQLAKQTVQPHKVVVMDHPPKTSGYDITLRYRNGFGILGAEGCDLFLPWEDDDWYHPRYLETMKAQWKLAGQPELFGMENVLYYHIMTQRYVAMQVPRRAPMMGTAFTPSVNKASWCPDDHPFTDVYFWNYYKGSKTFSSNEVLTVGIKHGMGVTAGIGHKKDWHRYNKRDNNFSYLASIVDPEALAFYKSLSQ